MWRQICHLEKFLHIRNVETIYSVLIYAVLSQNQFVLPFTLFCREINFVAIYAFLRGEKRTNIRYEILNQNQNQNLGRAGFSRRNSCIKSLENMYLALTSSFYPISKYRFITCSQGLAAQRKAKANPFISQKKKKELRNSQLLWPLRRKSKKHNGIADCRERSQQKD